MTKTYNEIRQLAYFRAAREMYGVAISVLLDTASDPVITEANLIWAAGVAERTFKKAHDLETLGHEEAIASARSERQLLHLRSEFTAAQLKLREAYRLRPAS